MKVVEEYVTAFQTGGGFGRMATGNHVKVARLERAWGKKNTKLVVHLQPATQDHAALLAVLATLVGRFGARLLPGQAAPGRMEDSPKVGRRSRSAEEGGGHGLPAGPLLSRGGCGVTSLSSNRRKCRPYWIG